MTNTKNQPYGTDVVEIFKHSDSELQELLAAKIAQYNNRSEGLHYKGLAAHVDWIRHKPLEMSLIELQDELKQGYTIVKVNVESLYFKAILRKPDKAVKAELRTLEEQVRGEYEQARYERNIAETARQIDIAVTSERYRQEAATAAELAIAQAARKADDEASALANLLAEYATPATS